MKKTIIFIIINIIFFVAIYTATKYFDIPYILAIIIFVVLYFVSIHFVDRYLNTLVNEQVLENEIMKLLKDDGYECEKTEGVLIYRMNDIWFRVNFWNKGNNCFRTEIIYSGSFDKDLNKVSFEGRCVLADYVNKKCRHIKFLSYEEGVACVHVTSVNNAKDFITEAKIAYRYICEAADTAIEVLPQLKQRYPNTEQNAPIGFGTKRNEDITDNDEKTIQSS